MINMNIIPELATLFKPAFILTSFIIAVFIIAYLSNLLIKKHPKGKLLIYPGAVLAVILLLYPYFYLFYPSDTFLYIFKALISVPLIFFIPGYVAYNALVKEKLNLDFSEVVFLQILTSILISGWIALTLAELGYFSLFNLLVLLIAFSIVLGWKYKVKFRLDSFPRPELNYKSIALVIILLIAVGLSFHPFENISMQQDANVYINTGVNVAHTGSLVIHDPIIKNMPDSIKSTFYKIRPDIHSYRLTYQEGRSFYGFIITNLSTGEIIPRYFHLYPTLHAISYSIFGLKNSLYIVPLLGVLSILSIFFVGKAMFSWEVGAISSLLLTISFTQIWFSRFANTEILSMFLIFSGLLTFILFNRTHNSFFGIISALCFGEALLTRVDAYLLIVPVALFFLYCLISRRMRKQHLLFIVPFILLLIHSIIQSFYINRAYTYENLGNPVIKAMQKLTLISFRDEYNIGSFNILNLFVLFVITLTLLILYLVYLNSPRIMKIFRNYSRLKKPIQYLIAILIILLSIYAYFIRPNISQSMHGQTLVMLGWYIGDLCIGLAIIGLVLLIYKKPNAETCFFVLIMSIYTLFYIYDLRNSFYHPWCMRRYVPVVIPSIMLCIGFTLYKIRRSKFYGNIISIILLTVLVASLLSISSPILGYVEFDGLIEQTEQISNYIDDDDSIIIFYDEFHQPSMALPLKYIYNKNVIMLWQKLPGDSRNVNVNKFIRMCDIWSNEGKSIYLVNPADEFAYNLSYYYTLQNKKEFKINVPRLGYKMYTSVNDLKSEKFTSNVRISQIDRTLYFYELKPTMHSKVDNSLFVEIGPNDLGYIKDFHATESKGNTTFRWTKDVSYVKMPISKSDAHLSLQLHINGWRPINVSPANVSLVVNSHLLTNFTAGRAWKTYNFTIPKEFLTEEPLIIEIHSETFVPCKYMDSSDQRDIGVMVDWIKLEKKTK